MSLIYMKKFLSALLLLLVIAYCSTASAQLSEGRLWSPVASDQFGGGSRLRSGFWGEIDYNYWLITQGKRTVIGDTSKILGTPYWLGGSNHYRINTMGTNQLSQDFHGGTTIRFGNQLGHHGWELKTTIMSSQSSSFTGQFGEMDINDPTGNKMAYPFIVTGDDESTGPSYGYYYSGSGTTAPQEMVTDQGYHVGSLWGWVETAGSTGNDFALTPLPITFDHYKIESKLSHWDVEANYIFRMHPTRIGFFEFTGGVRYMQLDDNLTFKGWGRPYSGLLENVLSSTNTSNTNSTDNTNNTNNTTDVTLLGGDEMSRTYYTGTAAGVGNILANSDWAFGAQNHIVGPQIGARYIRKVGRWSLICDTKFFAGFNAQRVTSRGTIATKGATRGTAGTGGETSGSTDSTDSTTSVQDSYSFAEGDTLSNLYPWTPLAYMDNAGYFNHANNLTEFTPGIDFRLMANWQLTDAIGITAGYQGMYLDKTARASLVNDYTIDLNGKVFGINENVNDQTWMHGFTLGVTMNRF
ncbi:MAG: hypothetical protein LBQ54_03160 [Planctomycetaceae bacterium]|jgi:hypothetical protein|nr:hypothetical protein [Planctomycetaceae bacterium]